MIMHKKTVFVTLVTNSITLGEEKHLHVVFFGEKMKSDERVVEFEGNDLFGIQSNASIPRYLQW